MGIYDRQYYREEQPRGIRLGGGQSMIITLVIINAAFFLANMFFGGAGKLDYQTDDGQARHHARALALVGIAQLRFCS